MAEIGGLAPLFRAAGLEEHIGRAEELCQAWGAVEFVEILEDAAVLAELLDELSLDFSWADRLRGLAASGPPSKPGKEAAQPAKAAKATAAATEKEGTEELTENKSSIIQPPLCSPPPRTAAAPPVRQKVLTQSAQTKKGRSRGGPASPAGPEASSHSGNPFFSTDRSYSPDLQSREFGTNPFFQDAQDAEREAGGSTNGHRNPGVNPFFEEADDFPKSWGPDVLPQPDGDGTGNNPFFADAALASSSVSASGAARANLRGGGSRRTPQPHDSSRDHYFEAAPDELTPNPFFDSLHTGTSASTSSRSGVASRRGLQQPVKQQGGYYFAGSEDAQNSFISAPSTSESSARPAKNGAFDQATNDFGDLGTRGVRGPPPRGWGDRGRGGRGGRGGGQGGGGGRGGGGREEASERCLPGPIPIPVEAAPPQQAGPSVLELLTEKKASEDAARDAKREAARQRRQAERVEAEHRLDPADGSSCTYNEICRKYRSTYSQTEIDAYWAQECR